MKIAMTKPACHGCKFYDPVSIKRAPHLPEEDDWSNMDCDRGHNVSHAFHTGKCRARRTKQ